MLYIRSIVFSSFFLVTGLESFAADVVLDAKGSDVKAIQLEFESQARKRAAVVEAARNRRQLVTDALQLDEPDNECIARDLSSKDCLVSVDQFNRTCENIGIDSSFDPLDRASLEHKRSQILETMLESDFPGLTVMRSPAKDSLLNVFATSQAKRVAKFKTLAGMVKLHSLYEKYRSTLFHSRLERLYQVMGSTDSTYLDSLRKTCLADSSRPWPTWVLEQKFLPLETGKIASSLKLGVVSMPIKVPWGYLLLKPIQESRITETSFEAALPVLTALAAAPDSLDPRIEAQIAAYYKLHQADLISPDTLSMRAWLVPGFKRSKGSFAADIRLRIRKEMALEDTQAVKPITIASPLLPGSLPLFISKKMRRIGSLTGPIRTREGDWYLKTLTMIPGTRRLDLKEARPFILKTLFDMDSDSPVTWALRSKEQKEKDSWKNIALEYLTRTLLPSPSRVDSLYAEAARNPASPEVYRDTSLETMTAVKSGLAMGDAARRLSGMRKEWMTDQVSIRFIEVPTND